MCKTKNARLPYQLEGEEGVKQGLKIVVKESRCNDVASSPIADPNLILS